MQYNISDTNYGILLSVSLLGLSSSRALSMSAIISWLLILTTRSCLLRPSAVVSPGWLKLQPKGMKTRTNKATTKITLHTETETLFIISPCYGPEQVFIVWAAQNAPLIINQLYKLPELLSMKNVPKWVRKYAKKKEFSYCFGKWSCNLAMKIND